MTSEPPKYSWFIFFNEIFVSIFLIILRNTFIFLRHVHDLKVSWFRKDFLVHILNSSKKWSKKVNLTTMILQIKLFLFVIWKNWRHFRCPLPLSSKKNKNKESFVRKEFHKSWIFGGSYATNWLKCKEKPVGIYGLIWHRKMHSTPDFGPDQPGS